MLHVVYRSYAGENRKPRPSYYSKDLALASMLRAFANLSCRAEIIFLNDGVFPPDRINTMMAFGEVLQHVKLGNKGSLRLAHELASERKWARDDLVWFAEDDYLYQDLALCNLCLAAQNNPAYAYFGLYALVGNRQPNGLPHIDCRVPFGWQKRDAQLVEGHPWSSALSTTSTFGVRVQALLQDRRMMSLAMETGGAFDHTICLAYQGFMPFPLRFLRDSLNETTRTKRVRTLIACLVRVLFNLYPLLRRVGGVTPRGLFSSDPAQITHMESDNMALGVDWEAVAAETESWAKDHQVHLGSSPAQQPTAYACAGPAG